MTRFSVAIALLLLAGGCRAHDEALLCAPCTEGQGCPLGLTCTGGLCRSSSESCRASGSPDGGPGRDDIPDHATCEASGQIHRVATEQDVREQLVGRWLLCGGWPLADEHELGVEFAADGNLYPLFEENGRAVRGPASRQWMIFNSVFGDLRVHLASPGGGELEIIPTFTDRPRKMDYASDIPSGTYLAFGESAEPPATTDYVPPPACYTTGTAHPTSSIAETESRLLGTWAGCVGFVGTTIIHGIVFRADHTFQYLDIDSAHRLVSKTGPLSEGTWRVDAPDSLHLLYPDSGEDGGPVHFRDGPNQLILGLSGARLSAVSAESYDPQATPPDAGPPLPALPDGGVLDAASSGSYCTPPAVYPFGPWDPSAVQRASWFYFDDAGGRCFVEFPAGSELSPRGVFFFLGDDATIAAATFGGAVGWELISASRGSLELSTHYLSEIPAGVPVSLELLQHENGTRLELTFSVDPAAATITIEEVTVH